VFRFIVNASRVYFYMIHRWFYCLFFRVFSKTGLTDEVLTHWSHQFFDFIMKMSKSELIVEGYNEIEKIPPGRNRIIISNHESFLDIPCVFGSMNFPVAFVAKKELGYVPFLKFWIKIFNGVFIDRKNLRKSLKVINEAIQHAQNRAFLIFPEGTRNKMGTVAPFKPGSLRLAFDSNAILIPVTVCGSRKQLEGSGFKVTPGKIFFKIHPALDTADIPRTERVAFTGEVYKTILSAYQALNARLVS